MSHHGIQLDRNTLSKFCRQKGILRLSLFGSILREDFGPKSDVDVLVEFDSRHISTLLDMVQMEMELTRIVGRKVDFRTPEDLSRQIREQVIRAAEVQYAA